MASLAAACTIGNHQSDNRLSSSDGWKWQLPPGFAPPPVPDTNPVTFEKIQLGRRLFYDRRLSVNGRGSCASCHQQQLAFTDGLANAIGVTGERHARSSMTLINVAYNSNYTWASRELRTLEQQIAIPLFNEQPVELGLSGNEETLVNALESDLMYARLFQRAYPKSASPVTIDNVIKSLATFVRTIIAADSAFDRLLFLGDQGAMSESALRGMRLFFSDDLHCGACHVGLNLAGGQHIAQIPMPSTEFHNTGLYNVGNRNQYPHADAGLRIESGDPDDDGKFIAPTLRNIALTSPYMHDGSIATLSEVIDHYASGGRTIHQGRFSGNGSTNAQKSSLLTGFELGATDKQDLLNFLSSLTDNSVLNDSRFSRPEDH